MTLPELQPLVDDIRRWNSVAEAARAKVGALEAAADDARLECRAASDQRAKAWQKLRDAIEETLSEPTVTTGTPVAASECVERSCEAADQQR